MVDVVKRLSFSDLSCHINQLLQKDQTCDVTAKLASLVRTLEALSSTVQTRVGKVRDTSLQQLADTGGRQALESQLRSQKQSLRDYGQKEAFFEYLKSLPDQHAFGPEIYHAEAALKSVKEELEQLEATNGKSERQLQLVINSISMHHEQLQAMLASLSHQLTVTAKDAEAQRTSMPLAPSSTQGTAPQQEEAEVELQAARSQAAALEARLAASTADCADADAALASALRDVAALEAEVTALQASELEQSQDAEATYQAGLHWCATISSLLGVTQGLTLLRIAEDEVVLQLTLHVPTDLHSRHSAQTASTLNIAVAQAGSATQASRLTTMAPTATAAPPVPFAGAAGPTMEKVFVLELLLQPGSSALRGLQLQPEVLDASEVVEDAYHGEGGSIPVLLSTMRSRLVEHCRRQLFIDEASQHYELRESARDAVVHAKLPSGSEVDVTVSHGWPDNGQTLHITNLRPNAAGAGALEILALVAREPPLVMQGSLLQVLDSVAAAERELAVAK